MRTILPENAVTVPDNAKRVFKGIIYDTYHWEQQLFDGASTTFEMLKRPDTVKVIAVDKDKVVILEQQQPNQKPFLIYQAESMIMRTKPSYRVFKESFWKRRD